MQVNYPAFVRRMIDRYEGGYGWDKGDPGGPTNFGITCYDLAKNRGQVMDSMTRWAPLVKAMTRAEAESIYDRKYAKPINFADLPSGSDVVMFDYGVNSGISRPVRVACALLKFPATGVMTRDLLTAIQKADPTWFVRSMNAERLHFMHQIRGGSAWEKFGKGWNARVQDLGVYALKLIVGAKTAPGAEVTQSHGPDLSTVPTPKATHDDPNVNTKGGSGGAGGMMAWLGGASWFGLPVWGLILGGVVIVAAAVAFIIWKNNRAQKLNETVVLPPGLVSQGV